MLHEIYLPFKEDVLQKHFKYSDNDSPEILEKRIAKFEKSIKNYSEYISEDTDKKMWKILRQIEKDETFWTASSLMTIFHSNNSKEELKNILIKAFGKKPPLEGFSNWEDCLKDDLKLFFEPRISSPIEYRKYLQNEVENRNFIPHILDNAKNKKGEYHSLLEKTTNVDALLLNSDNGFNVFFEAKVLSDISYKVTYDSMRNQIIRNIDVMLSKDNSKNFLNKRKPEKSLFLLLTPALFKTNQRSRLYGYVFNDYKKNPELLKADLPHRKDLQDFEGISKRIGWITWEDLKNINSDCCKWINKI